MPDFAVSIDSLTKFFPPARTGWRAFLQPFEKPTIPALHQLSLDIRAGESVALLGANGAGKSTLLRILSTLLLPTSGRAFLAGHDAAQFPSEVRRNLGYHAGSDLGFYPRLTGRQNLLFFAQLNHLPAGIARDRIDQFAAQFELSEALDRQVRTLSSGTIQRLSLARALMHSPRILLLDEPTRSLDAIAAASFRHFLKSQILQSGATSLLFASHSLPEIELLAHRVAILKKGRLIALDSPAALIQQTASHSLEEAFFRLTGHAHDLPAEEVHL
ncbi:MAG: ABC transporter ATP-binding protein [Acidobacteria bacterium]|nr:ABC transporter ATP-binding protein [Acidobacteriota bacterium]MBS1864630.1 ABC transporter ATP-binding protein [Acidobacteriota bacterium]